MSVPMRTAPEPDCLGSAGFATAGTLARASEGMLAIASRACDTKRRRDHEARGSSVPFGARRPTGMMTFPSMAALFAPFGSHPGAEHAPSPRTCHGPLWSTSSTGPLFQAAPPCCPPGGSDASEHMHDPRADPRVVFRLQRAEEPVLVRRQMRERVPIRAK